MEQGISMYVRPNRPDDMQFIPYDEDDNDSFGSSSDIEHAEFVTATMKKAQNEFILSSCMINPQYSSIDIQGADLSQKFVDIILRTIYQRLSDIVQKRTFPTETLFDDPESSEYTLSTAILEQLNQMQSTLKVFRLIYVGMDCSSLSLLSSIIKLSENTLYDLQLELVITPLELDEDDPKVPMDPVAEEMKFCGIWSHLLSQCGALPKLKGIGIDLINFPLDCYDYFRYFQPLHTFTALRSLRIFIVKELKKIYIEHLIHFIIGHTPLRALRITINDIEDDCIWDSILSVNAMGNHIVDITRFQLNDQTIAKFNEITRSIISALDEVVLEAFSLCHYLSDDLMDYMDILDRFLSNHGTLCELNLVFNSMSDAALCRLARCMNQNEVLMANLEVLDLEFAKLEDFELAESICWADPGISNTFDPLIEIENEMNGLNMEEHDVNELNETETTDFTPSLSPRVVEMRLKSTTKMNENEDCNHSFNDSEDGDDNESESEDEHDIDTDDIDAAEAKVAELDHRVQHQTQYLLQNRRSNRWYQKSSCHSLKQLHFGKESVSEIAILVRKCHSLRQCHLKCYFGVEVNGFLDLMQSIECHGNLHRFTIHNIQRRDELFDGMRSMFEHQKHSFLNYFSVVLNRHYLDTLRREKYTIPDSYYEAMNEVPNDEEALQEMEENDRIEKELRPNLGQNKVILFVDALFESQNNIMRYIEGLRNNLGGKLVENVGFPRDIIEIIVGFVLFDEREEDRNVLVVTMRSLPNDLKSAM